MLRKIYTKNDFKASCIQVKLNFKPYYAATCTNGYTAIGDQCFKRYGLYNDFQTIDDIFFGNDIPNQDEWMEKQYGPDYEDYLDANLMDFDDAKDFCQNEGGEALQGCGLRWMVPEGNATHAPRIFPGPCSGSRCGGTWRRMAG